MAEHSSGAFRTSIGGQALIEGILMRGPEKQAIVGRDKDGQLVEKAEAHQGPLPHFGHSPDPGHRKFPGGDGQRREGPDVLRGLLPGGGREPALQI